MAFCKYCGNQYEDGQQCNCPGAQAERAAATNNQGFAPNGAPQQQFAQQPYGQPYAPANNIGPELGQVFKKFFVAPVEMFQDAMTATSNAAQFIALGISALVTLIFSWLAFGDVFDDEAFKYAFFVVLITVALKAVHCVVAFLIKDNAQLPFGKLFAAFGTATIFDAIASIVMFFIFKMCAGADSGTAIVTWVFGLFFAWTVAGGSYTKAAYTVATKKESKIVNAFAITAAVCCFIVVAIMVNAAEDSLSLGMFF